MTTTTQKKWSLHIGSYVVEITFECNSLGTLEASSYVRLVLYND